MQHPALIAIIAASLAGCGGDNDNDTTPAQRNLSSALSFQQLIDRRLANDTSINGKTVLIRDAVHSSFDGDAVCSSALVCDTKTSNIPGYLGSNDTQNCYQSGIYLRQEPVLEQIEIDLKQHTDFYQLTGKQARAANFYAKITFVERDHPCSSTPRKDPGLKIELKAGEEQHLLEQLLQPQN